MAFDQFTRLRNNNATNQREKLCLIIVEANQNRRLVDPSNGTSSQLFLSTQPEDPVRHIETKKKQIKAITRKKKTTETGDIESIPWMATSCILFRFDYLRSWTILTIACRCFAYNIFDDSVCFMLLLQ